jgi:hypothetical protein
MENKWKQTRPYIVAEDIFFAGMQRIFDSSISMYQRYDLTKTRKEDTYSRIKKVRAVPMQETTAVSIV